MKEKDRKSALRKSIYMVVDIGQAWVQGQERQRRREH
jgi:hypothetical protein